MYVCVCIYIYIYIYIYAPQRRRDLCCSEVETHLFEQESRRARSVRNRIHRQTHQTPNAVGIFDLAVTYLSVTVIPSSCACVRVLARKSTAPFTRALPCEIRSHACLHRSLSLSVSLCLPLSVSLSLSLVVFSPLCIALPLATHAHTSKGVSQLYGYTYKGTYVYTYDFVHTRLQVGICRAGPRPIFMPRFSRLRSQGQDSRSFP